MKHIPFAPPRSTPGPPARGVIGSEPTHFRVEEVPAYPLSGEGEHVFLWVEKSGLTTSEVAKRIARASGLRERDVGYAGMKDKNAITRQWFSVCTKDDEALGWDLGEGADILQANRHKNKLRTGHLIGNRFVITLVEVPDGALESAELIAEHLRTRGLPNYFGPQRFGREGRNLDEAFMWLEGQKEQDTPAPEGESNTSSPPGSESAAPLPEAPQPERRPRRKRRKGGKRGDARFENKLLPSVLQSEIFNRYLHARLAQGTRLLKGEIVRLDQAAKCFIVDDVEAENPRYLRGDLHLMGPMPGPKTLQAHSEARCLEEEIEAQLGLTEEHFAILAKHAPGARRDLLIYPEKLEISENTPGELLVDFTLPAGAYATQLIREFSGADWSNPRGY